MLTIVGAPAAAQAAAAPRPDSAACERWRILTEKQTSRTAKAVDHKADELAFHHCMTGSTADDAVALRDLDGDYSARADAPCSHSAGYLSALTSSTAGGPSFAPAGGEDERVEAECIADKAELLRYFYARPDACYDAIDDPYLFGDKCRWHSRLQVEKFEHAPWIGWWVTIALAVVVVIGAAAGASAKKQQPPHPLNACQLCGATHSTDYHRGRGG